MIDSNVYIRATRDDEWSARLELFLAEHIPWVYLHSVVALELLAGASDPDLERKTQANLIRPFERRGRVITPGADAWKRAGSAIARLLRERKLSPNGIKRSFVNDCLIAASAREHGFALLTDNQRDFALLEGVLPMERIAPWPDAEI